MKILITALALCLISTFALAEQAASPAAPASAPKYKEVCKEKNNKKVCKRVRVHKKLDGKPVPQK